MKRPTAMPVDQRPPAATAQRTPRAFDTTEASDAAPLVESLSDAPPPEAAAPVLRRRSNWLVRLLAGAASLLVSLALGLAADSLIRSLFDTAPWLGWVGVAVLAIFVLALVALVAREVGALWRLRSLDHLKLRADGALASDRIADARAVARELAGIYAPRPDMSRALERFRRGEAQVFDGGEMVRFAERTLMTPLDARARALTAASARRVALVTAVSPRALIDVGFVIWESIRLGGAIARLYGARPGFWSSWRLVGAILGHLAVTGGLVLTDGVVEQLVGQGLAARLSQRLGEGVVNGLMTVRVGIAAMRVVRPLPFTTEPQPAVKDFLPELVNVLKTNADGQPPA